jgi:hypothetical protein
VLFEWLRDRLKEQAKAEIVSLINCKLYSEPIDISMIGSCFFFKDPCHESARFKKKIVHEAILEKNMVMLKK